MEKILNKIEYNEIFTLNYNELIKKDQLNNKPIKIVNGININYEIFIEKIIILFKNEPFGVAFEGFASWCAFESWSVATPSSIERPWCAFA